MSVVIATNPSAALAANNLAYSSAMLQKSLNRLSSGSKIANPSDDAGGMAVSMKLSATANRDASLQDNLGDAASYARTQDGAFAVVGSILDRISQLETLYKDPTKNSSDLANYDSEFTQLASELSSVGNQTFNGVNLFGAGSLSVDTTDDLGTAGAISVAQSSLLSPTAQTLYTAGFSNLNGWSTSGNASASGGNLWLGGSDVYSTATTNQSFGAGIKITMNLSIPGSGDTFSISHGNDTLVTFVGGANISRNTLHSLEIDLSSTGTASIYLDGSSTPMQTSSGLSTASGAISMSDIGAGPGLVNNFSVSTLTNTASLASVTSATSLGSLSLSTVTTAIQAVATDRARNGAEQSRLGFASTLLSTNSVSLEAAISRISDVDVAQETTELARWNVLVQAGTSVLTQANQSAQVALKLITG